PTANTNTVIAYDHRLIYVIKGKGVANISNTEYSLQAGTVFYIMSGTPYTIKSETDDVLQLISLNFDFIKAAKSVAPYLPLTSPAAFDKNQLVEVLNFSDATYLNSPVVLNNMPQLYTYLKAVMDEHNTNDNFSETQISHLLCLVFNFICRSLSEPKQTNHIRNYKKIINYIHEHYFEEIDNKTLSKIFNYHPNYISQLIKKHTGISLHQYLLNVRIRNALLLIETTDMPISEIGVQVGFNDSSYFSQYFKKCTGHSPKEFRV
ncbi:MAG: helix-turn-helix domain-containing protein, partial [Clostridia bacterium]|nr:helix-turn-helix domain-containing protein [Clostridia bacterium]